MSQAPVTLTPTTVFDLHGLLAEPHILVLDCVDSSICSVYLPLHVSETKPRQKRKQGGS